MYVSLFVCASLVRCVVIFLNTFPFLGFGKGRWAVIRFQLSLSKSLVGSLVVSATCQFIH